MSLVRAERFTGHSIADILARDSSRQRCWEGREAGGGSKRGREGEAGREASPLNLVLERRGEGEEGTWQCMQE